MDRARIILLSHEGLTVETIAKQLGTRPARVSKWRQRFDKDRLDALSDAPRPGKPQKYTADTEKRVLAYSISQHQTAMRSGTDRFWRGTERR